MGRNAKAIFCQKAERDMLSSLVTLVQSVWLMTLWTSDPAPDPSHKLVSRGQPIEPIFTENVLCKEIQGSHV